MKALANIADRRTVYSIEAARFSCAMMKSSFTDLERLLQTLERDSVTDGVALSIFKATWLFVDMGFRFARTLAQIRGLKHGHVAYHNVELALVGIEKARNYIQHLNSQLSGLSRETYPVLGALSWPSNDRQRSFTIAIGGLPGGTTFHSLTFDTVAKQYLGDVMLAIDKFSLNVSLSNKQLCEGFDYLSSWIEESGYAAQEEVRPNIAIISALNLGSPTKRYLRIKFDINTGKVT